VVESRYMKIKPSRGHYVISIPETTQTKAGLDLVDSHSNSAPVMGVVVSAPEAVDGPVHEEGTVLLFRKYAVDELKFMTNDGEQKLFILEARDILGTVDTLPEDGVDS
jgi:co-chaperonin GroES (HSP10)